MNNLQNKMSRGISGLLICLSLFFVVFLFQTTEAATKETKVVFDPQSNKGSEITQVDPSDYNGVVKAKPPEKAQPGDRVSGFYTETGQSYVYEATPSKQAKESGEWAGVEVTGQWVPTEDPFKTKKHDYWICKPNGKCELERTDDSPGGWIYRTEAECLRNCKPHGTYKICRPPKPLSLAWLNPATRDKLYCKNDGVWEGTRPPDQCQTDNDCGKPVSTPSSVSCNVCVGEKCQSKTFNVSSCSQVTGYTLCSSDSQCKTSTTPTSSIRCNVCIGEKCQSRTFNLSSCSRITNYTRCSSDQDCKGTPPPPPPPPSPTCSINKFELPNHVWTGVDYEAKWSTNSDCKWGEITCKLGDKDCRDNETLSGNVTVGSINHEKSFHIKTPGVYTYQLKACYDKNNEDTCDIWEDTLGTGLNYIEVQAVNLPWWQEIIPVLPDKLQGFLRGLIS